MIGMHLSAAAAFKIMSIHCGQVKRAIKFIVKIKYRFKITTGFEYFSPIMVCVFLMCFCQKVSSEVHWFYIGQSKWFKTVFFSSL